MKEKITEILSEYVIHCNTEKKAIELLRILHSYGYVWNNGHSLLTSSYWKIYKGNTYYTVSEGPYKASEYAILFGTIEVNPGKEIITFDEFKELLNMEKEIKIKVPKGYEIDEENSTFECIKFKPIKKVETYDDVARELFLNKQAYFINTRGRATTVFPKNDYNDLNNCITVEQVEKLLAINKLMNVAKYLNKDWKPAWENAAENKYYICLNHNSIGIFVALTAHSDVAYFPDRETAKKAIEILGEDTIKLALGDY